MSYFEIYDNFISSVEVKNLLTVGVNSSDSSWNAMNEEELNGKFWNGKRMMIDPRLSTDLKSKTDSLFEYKYSITAANKLQRFYTNDVLGPLVDQDFVPEIEYACAFFLHDDFEGGGIMFNDIDKHVKPKANTLVVYPGNLKYSIMGPSSEGYMHFITMFFNRY